MGSRSISLVHLYDVRTWKLKELDRVCVRSGINVCEYTDYTLGVSFVSRSGGVGTALGSRVVASLATVLFLCSGTESVCVGNGCCRGWRAALGKLGRELSREGSIRPGRFRVTWLSGTVDGWTDDTLRWKVISV